MMTNEELILYSEDDIEQISLLSDDELQNVVNQMILIGKRNFDNYNFLNNEPWYKRALATISGKLKRTQKQIATDQALISTYCVQLVYEIIKRGILTQSKVKELEYKVDEIYQQFRMLLENAGTEFEKIDKYNTLLFGILSGYYDDSLISAIHISRILSNINIRSEKFNVIMNAINRNILSPTKTTTQRLMELSNATDKELNYYQAFSEKVSGRFAKTIKICLKLIEADCFDEVGALKATQVAGFTNDILMFHEFIAEIIITSK